MTFEAAYKRLEEIYQLCMSSQVIDVEKMVQLQEEARICHEICEQALLKTEQELAQPTLHL